MAFHQKLEAIASIFAGTTIPGRSWCVVPERHFLIQIELLANPVPPCHR